MREIKFRQWESDRKMMHYNIGVSKNMWSGFIKVNWDRSPIMQYTGLKDKNGEEIYDQDLLVYDGQNDDVLLVHWDDEDAVWCYREVTYGEQEAPSMSIADYLFTISPLSDYRVIGNIHENQELL